MLKPHKYLDLETCVLFISGEILRILSEENIIEYDSLYKRVCDITQKELNETFLPALNLLYLLGKINYQKSIDSIKFVRA